MFIGDQEKFYKFRDQPVEQCHLYLYFAASLFKNARLLFKDKTYRLYEKPGGYNQALDDFDLLRPNNVERAGVSIYCVLGIDFIFGGLSKCKLYLIACKVAEPR